MMPDMHRNLGVHALDNVVECSIPDIGYTRHRDNYEKPTRRLQSANVVPARRPHVTRLR